ncbi:hypothetical protein EZV73_22215 [Acidaminobacter sp. JC074]|uniref:tyrosine-protein phosphatase n=1 Tax=Acidaminobacter sp. JC074 TaxID=2530199 RepID=UPI001F108E97|nr:CpsB/CapC family capsule biosynthesis tyrosine phosphatase [Acidaminobacter sp. JC074]MCH4890314.1 hypothetical protein [Acidaminobacter sp. JC074]
MIDLHSHIIFDVDDGSGSLDESMAIIKRAYRHGITKMFTTSHYIDGSMTAEKEEVLVKLDVLKEKLEEEKIPVDLFPGHEIFLDNQVVDYIESEKALSLNGSKYILVELPMLNELNNLEDILFEIHIKGYVPIIAHPERYVYVQRDTDCVKKWIESGALLQLNLPSLYGKYGPLVEKTAKSLLKRQMIHFVGSDVHNIKSRALSIEKPLGIIDEILGKEKLYQITDENPLKVINNEIIEPFDILDEKVSFMTKIRKFIG